MAINSLSTSTLNGDVLTNIRQAVGNFLQRCGLQYMDIDIAIDEGFYSELYQEAINRGFPMDGDYSVRAYMNIGAAMSNAYAHHPDPAIRMWICLFSVVGICIDDMADKGKDLVHVYSFNDRFTRCEPQGNLILSLFDVLLRDVVRQYSPPVSNLIVTSSLNFVSSYLLDNETKNMQISAHAPLYPEYLRLMSGVPDPFTFCIFPSTLPLREYIQCIPHINIIVNHTNDILSCYKEEIEGETTTYLIHMAASRALTPRDALHEVIEKTVQSHHYILESLRPHTEAYDAYVSWFAGYVKFHAVSRRYMMEEVMSESSSS
ncbi:isoprenoid synthase domain-containing protein [Suillus lakei]|nr:isoprenoid synthase domain-containing protein [Suillus lakei]